MKFLQKVALASLITLYIQEVSAQDITGLWEVVSVQIGDQQRTPIARWTNLMDDGTYQSGNGWLKNSMGVYDYDEANQTIWPTETDGLQIKDPAGAFSMEVMKDKMVWKREEDGMPVTVTWSRIEEVPKAPAEKFFGLWMLTHIKSPETDSAREIEESELQMFLIRWDRIYREMSKASGRKTGYWHMNSHAPEVTMLPHTQGDPAESWALSFADDKLIMTGISDTNRGIERTYLRQNQYPD